MKSEWMVALALLTCSGVAQGVTAGSFDAATAAVRRPGAKVRVELVGDSTETETTGYGRGFCANLAAAVDCLVLAKSGTSTGTYREQGLWAQALATMPDFMLIQFGHDEPEQADGIAEKEGQVSSAVYEADLRRFVAEARAARVEPVLVTPLSRRLFGGEGKIHSDLTAQSEATRRVAKDLAVPLVDLQAQSIALLDQVGETRANALAITTKDDAGKTVFENTHLNWAGSFVFGRIVAKGLGEVEPALAQYVLPEAATLPPEGLKAMRTLNGAPVKIVLVGDSTVAPEGGWGPGFCAVLTPNVTCVDLALNGRSSKSFLEEGAWAKAIAAKGDYYLIQFGHNDGKPDAARHTDAETTFKSNLRRYIAEVRLTGAVPVLVTSLSRRTYKDGHVVEDLNVYASATRTVGAEQGVAVVDLNALSTALLNHLTQAQADEYDAQGHADEKAENATQAKLDRTHLNAYGQAIFGRMVADALVRTQVELGPDVVGEPAGHSVVPSIAPRQVAPAHKP